MTEHTLTASWLTLLRSQCDPANSVITKHADEITSGVPDVSVTLGGMTSWWEVKCAKPYIKWRNDLQKLNCRRYERAGVCFLVVYEVVKGMHRTHILSPALVENGRVPDNGGIVFAGHAHQALCDFVQRVHRDPSAQLFITLL